MQRLKHSIGDADESEWTAETAPSDDLHYAVAGWLDAECVRTQRFTTNARILWSEFRMWSGIECTQDEFAAGLERSGLAVDRGMVEALALNEDFFAAVEYERERLRNKKAVQLDLFSPTRQDTLPKAS
jgi:hypothetical protein